MHDQRFQFLEVATGPEPLAVPTASPSVQETPPDQYLSLHDLVALQPTAQAMRALSRKLAEKYRFVPLTIVSASLKPRLPRHLDERWHGTWQSESPFVLYLAMHEHRNAHALRLIHNACGYSLQTLPIQHETFTAFLRDHYERFAKN